MHNLGFFLPVHLHIDYLQLYTDKIYKSNKMYFIIFVFLFVCICIYRRYVYFVYNIKFYDFWSKKYNIIKNKLKLKMK